MLILDQRFTHKGQSVAWGRVGDGDPIVMVHGFPWSAQSWRRVVPWLANSHEVFFFDMLGCGQSEKSDAQNVTESVQSDLLATLIKHWGLNRPQIVAHDFGGLAALRGHFVDGIEYGRLHLIDPVAVLPSGSPFYAHVANHEDAFAGLPAYAHEALLKAYIQNAAHYPLREEAMSMYIEPWTGTPGQAAFYRQISHSDNDNISEVESLYQKPDFNVHLIWGAQDTFIPVSRGEQLRQMLSANSMKVVNDAAHLVQEDAPEALVGELLRNIR